MNIGNLAENHKAAASHATDFFDLWLACETQERIADAVGVTQGAVAKSIPNGDIAEWNKSDQAGAGG